MNSFISFTFMMMSMIILQSCAFRKKGPPPPQHYEVEGIASTQKVGINQEDDADAIGDTTGQHKHSNEGEPISFDEPDWFIFSEKTQSEGAMQNPFQYYSSLFLRGVDSGYGVRISTRQRRDLENRSLLIKWKAKGKGKFAGFHISLYYNQNASGSDRNRKVDLTNFSSGRSQAGSKVIEESVWYFTFISISDHSATATTARKDYHTNGGEVVARHDVALPDGYYGHLAFRIGDPYAGEMASMLIDEIRIIQMDTPADKKNN
jgi:hypothetical protein